MSQRTLPLHDCGNDDQRRFYFHLALARLAAQNLDDYYNCMNVCVGMKSNQYRTEFLVAHLECQRLQEIIQANQDSCGFTKIANCHYDPTDRSNRSQNPRKRQGKLKKLEKRRAGHSHKQIRN